jgi:hypothetical protein
VRSAYVHVFGVNLGDLDEENAVTADSLPEIKHFRAFSYFDRRTDIDLYMYHKWYDDDAYFDLIVYSCCSHFASEIGRSILTEISPLISEFSIT